MEILASPHGPGFTMLRMPLGQAEPGARNEVTGLFAQGAFSHSLKPHLHTGTLIITRILQFWGCSWMHRYCLDVQGLRVHTIRVPAAGMLEGRAKIGSGGQRQILG